jgi:isocitrate lyase
MKADDKATSDATAREALQKDWQTNPRWKGVQRPYSANEVLALRPSVLVEHTLARRGAERFWRQLVNEPYVNALGAMTGAQAVQMVKAGLKAIYMSGWQVAADSNLSGQTYPDQSLYPANSVPALVRRVNNALIRADQIERQDAKAGSGSGSGSDDIDWYAPILADAEAGFGGPLHAFELMKAMIEAGASAVHFEDQLASEKKCGHLGGKVLVPTSQFQRVLTAARLAADVCSVPTCIVARTDALGATLLTSDIDPIDKQFCTGERTPEGFFRVKAGLDSAIARALAYAPYADLLWFETSVPDTKEAKRFAEAIHAKHPGKLLAYNCSPSFNWEKKLNAQEIARFQAEMAEYGYKFQFITLAGWHSVNYHMFDLAQNYKASGMTAYVDLQRREFQREEKGYTATRHQREVGTGYFDQVLMAISGGKSSTAAYAGSTEQEQFEH